MAGVAGVGGAAAVGGAGMGVGGAGSVGAGAGVSAGAVASVAPTSTTTPVTAPEAGVKVTISQAGMKLANEPTQVGANFSVSHDKGGHQYVGGMDANGCRAPSSVDSAHNANGQSYAELNKMDDMLAAALLAALLGDKHDKGHSSVGCVLAAAQAIHAINAYTAMSKM